MLRIALCDLLRLGYVYIAGPLHTPGERMYLEIIRDICLRHKYDTYLPHVDGGLSPADGSDNEKYFQADIRALNRATLVVAVLNGTDVDSGTAWEIGYAYAKSIPIIGIVEDTRKWNPQASINLMITSSVIVTESTSALNNILELRAIGSRWRLPPIKT